LYWTGATAGSSVTWKSELFDRRPRDRREGRVARVQVAEMADVVDPERAGRARLVGVGLEHQVIDQ
jgi:hypothetical protein